MIEIDFLKCLAAFECEVMTPHDRLVLGYELSMLPKRYFQRAVNLVLMQNPGLLATMSNNVIEFDINKMDPLTLAQLQDLVQNLKKRVAKSKPQNKHGEPSERKRRKRSASPLRKGRLELTVETTFCREQDLSFSGWTKTKASTHALAGNGFWIRIETLRSRS